MNKDLQIGMIGIYGGHPLDILLPAICENELKTKVGNSGHCFHIYSMTNTEIYLFCKSNNGIRQTAKVDIRSSCKSNSDISLYIVKMNNGSLCLRTYIDSSINGLFPIPTHLYQ